MASKKTTLGYDPLDQLTSHTLPEGAVRQRFYCQKRLATEIQSETKVSIIQHEDLLLAQQQREGDAVDTTLLATDQQRTVLQTLKNDQQPQPIAYSPYGHRSALSGLLSLLGFNGERPDPVTGCYLLGNGYRAFNPVLMRFNSPDSWSPFGKGGLNSYVYCLGDPVNQADPTGHVGVSALVRRYNGPNVPPPTSPPSTRTRHISPPPPYSRATHGVQGPESVTPLRTVTAQPIATSNSALPPAYSVDARTFSPPSTSEEFIPPSLPPSYFEVVNSSQTGNGISRSAPHRTLQPGMNAPGVVNQRENARPTTSIEELRQIRQQATRTNRRARDLLVRLERMNRELEDASGSELQ